MKRIVPPWLRAGPTRFTLVTVAALATLALACSARTDVGADVASGGPGAGALPGAAAQPASTGATVLALGTGHGCALLEDATVACWGFNPAGQTGVAVAESPKDRDYPFTPVPRRVEGLGGIVQLTADWQTSCALDREGRVWCWGVLRALVPSSGVPASHVPTLVPGLDSVVEVRSGGGPACARRADGTVWCWGDNSYRSVGASATPPGMGSPMREILPPTQVPGITDAKAIAVSDDLSCALHRSGEVSCWGRVEIDEGRYVSDSEVPRRIPGVTGITALALAQSSVLALREDGKVMVWGGGAREQGILQAVAKDRSQNAVAPTLFPGLEGIVAVSAQYHTMCALHRDGGVLCWGHDFSGELGTGESHSTPRTTPARVPGVTARRLAVGTWTSCAETTASEVVCWGGSSSGSLGAGEVGGGPAKPGKPVLLPARLALGDPRGT